MKFTISKDKLNSLVQKVLNIVPVRSTLPVLSNILLEADKDKVKMRATDLDVAITSELGADVKNKGTLTVPGRMFADLIRELPEGDVVITGVDKRIEVKSERGLYKIAGINADEFPRFPKIDFTDEVKIDTDVIKGMISKSIFAVSRDETRPALNGVLWKCDEGVLTMVATNGHILAKVEQSGLEVKGIEKGVIVPPKALEYFSKLSGDAPDEIGVVFASDNLVLNLGDTILTTRLIDGPYPNFEQVIPKEHNKRAVFDKDEFLALIRRVSILSNNITHQIKLVFGAESIEAMATNYDIGGEGRDEIAMDYQGEELEIGYNAIYLIDIMKHVETDQAVMEFTTGTAAALINSTSHPENQDYCFLIMPLRLAE